MHGTSASVNDESDLVYSLRCRIEDLERALGSEWRAPMVLNLTAFENRVLGLIVAKQGYASVPVIFDVMYGDDSDPPDEVVVRVLVWKTRRKLRAHGVSIKTQFGTGRASAGYFITPDNLARLNALYAPGERPTEDTP